MTDPVRVAVVGLGYWGPNLVRNLHELEQGEVLHVCDLDEARARRVAETFGCDWTTSLDDVARSDVQAVTIATPDHLHRDPAIAMLSAGKHVLELYTSLPVPDLRLKPAVEGAPFVPITGKDAF